MAATYIQTGLYRPYPYYPYGPTGITKPVLVSPAQAAIMPAITINMPAQPTPVTPVQSGAPAAVAAQESWFEQSAVGGISNKVLVGLAAVAGLIFFSRKK